MFNRQNRFGFGAPAMGPMAGFGAGYNVNRRPSYAPGAVQVSNLPMPAQYAPNQLMPGQEEDFNALMAQLNAEAGSTSPESPIRAPRDRGMFGRFAGFNPFRFDPDKGVGEGNRLYAIGATLAGMGAGDPALTASLLEPKLKANRERVAARDEAERERQRMEAFMQTADLTPSERAAFNLSPDAALQQYLERTGRPPQQAEYGLELVPVRDPETGRTVYVQASKAGGVRTVEGFEPVPEEPQTYASHMDARGVRRYTEGPDIGKPVPGFETPRPESGGIRIGPDGTVVIGGPAEGLGYGSGSKGSEAAIAFDRQGNPIVTPAPQQAQYNKAENFVKSKTRTINLVRDDIRRARELVNDPAATGPVGAVGRSLPIVGPITPGGRLASRIKTIKTNIGFDKLDEMRQNSPTGGALGNVTEKEIDFLQSVAGELDNAQTNEDVDYVLRRIDSFYVDLQNQYNQAFAADFPSLETTFQRRGSTNQQMQNLSELYDFMTPEERALFEGDQ